MSFVGLDWGSGIGQYAQILREADAARKEAERNAVKDKIYEQQAAYTYGWDSPNVQYMAEAGIPMEALMAMGGDPGRAPAGRQPMYGPQDGMGMNAMPQDGDSIEADMLAADLDSGMEGMRRNPMPPGRQGSSSANDMPPPPGTEYVPGGLQQFSPKKFQEVKKQAQEINKEYSGDDQQKVDLYADEISRLIEGAKQSGLIRGGKIHPFVARQIQALRMQRLEGMDKGRRSLADEILLKMIGAKEDKPDRGRAPVDPTIAIKRKVDMLTQRLPPQPKRQTGLLAGRKNSEAVYQQQLQEWRNQNAAALAEIDALIRGGESPAQQAAPATKKDPNAGKKLFNGKWYTREEYQKAFGKK